MLIIAGLIGTTAGVALFTLLRRLGQLDLTIAVSYLLLLGIVGCMMVVESVRAILRARRGRPAEIRRPGSHIWIHGLPLKMRFKISKIYVSVIPIWTIGFVIGFIGAIMGIGGGFMLVPALIYLIRVPTGVVIGTSMVLTLVTMAYATIIHAATNHLVDALLALILMIGGVIGAQFGARTGQRFSGEQLRLLLGMLVLSVGLRFAYDLVVQPADLFTMRVHRGAAMSARRSIALASLLAALLARATPARGRAADLDALHLARADRVELHRRRRGPVRLGRARRADGRAARRLRHRRDGQRPARDMVTRRKERMVRHLGQCRLAHFVKAPSYLAAFADRPLDKIAAPDVQRRQQLGLNNVLLTQRVGTDYADVVQSDPFRRAFIRLRTEQGLYSENTSAVTFLTPTLFRTGIPLPAEVPIGTYNIGIKLFSDGALIAKTDTAFEIVKVGFEQFVATAARQHGFVYGVATAAMALMAGWMASIVFRKD